MKRIMMIGIGIVVAAAAIAGATTFSQSSGGGFEQLEAWTSVLDQEDAARMHVFEFAAPRAGFRVDGEAVEAVNIPYALQKTLLAPRYDAAVVEMTGFDLAGTATAMMVFDNHPKLLVLFAVPENAAGQEAFSQAYDERDFATEIVDGVTIRHIREDGVFEPALLKVADPFDGERGQAQRVAYINGTLAGTATWDGIRQAVAGLAENAQCEACLPWREVLAGLRTETGKGAHLTMADGWNAGAFRVEQPLSDAGLPIPLSPLPPFDTVLFAATEQGRVSSAHLVVRFPNASDAEAAMGEITKRINAAVTLRGRLETRLNIEKGAIHTIGEAGAAVMVLTFSSQDDQASTTAAALSTMAGLALGGEFLGLAWN